jgi:DNA-directed RNA polymerase subunit M
MQFCDDCGSMMTPRDGTMVCEACGASTERDDERAAAFVSTDEQTDDDLVESDAEANFEGKPTATDVRCDDCGHGEAWYTIKQTASADEPPTRFFKCKNERCDNYWREYG